VTAWCRRLALAALVLAVAAGALPAQTPAATAGNLLNEEFRQQVPLGAITGDSRTLRQRILSATSYRMTAGDTYELQIQIGSDRVATFPLVLQDDYELEIPYVGTIDVANKLFSDVRREVVRRIKAQGTVRFASLVLRQPALFDVFIFGGVANPGIYTMTPLSRVSDLVTAAKGPQAGSSLRRVELTRDGAAGQLDLTRFSTHGELSANPTLAPGDRVRVPRAERLVTVDGLVAFPGAFDLLAGEGIEDLIRFAGGVVAGAGATSLSLIRTRAGVPEVLHLTAAERRTFRLVTGDRVTVSAATQPRRKVLVQGALFGQPAAGDAPVQLPTQQLVLLLPFRSGMSVLEVLDQVGGPTPLARPERSTVLRAATGARLPVDVGLLWDTRDAGLDLPLEPGDQLHVPMRDLNVYIGGEVNAPRAVPHVAGHTIGDYLRSAGGLTDDGAPRFTVIDVDHRRSPGTRYTQPEPGSTILAEKNVWSSTKQILGEVMIVTGIATVLLDLIIKIIDNQSKIFG
jgi:protein involved in polysaccharide export with SLBB domain